jgi:hypothetical protein
MNRAKPTVWKYACIKASRLFCVVLKPKTDCAFAHENLLYLVAAMMLPSGS